MSEDWEDKMYDYDYDENGNESFFEEIGAGEDDQNEFSEGGESPGQNFGDGGDENPELNFGEEFKDRQRTAGGDIKAGGPGTKTRFEKSMRSAEDAAIEKARGILGSETSYDAKHLDVKESEKEKITTLISKIEHVERFSIEVLTAALLFKIRRLDLGKDFEKFSKKMDSTINPFDLIRYIRIVAA